MSALLRQQAPAITGLKESDGERTSVCLRWWSAANPRQRPSILSVDKVNVADTVYVAPFSTPICSEEKASLALVRSPSHLGACEAYLIILSTVLRVNDVG